MEENNEKWEKGKRNGKTNGREGKKAKPGIKGREDKRIKKGIYEERKEEVGGEGI